MQQDAEDASNHHIDRMDMGLDLGLDTGVGEDVEGRVRSDKGIVRDGAKENEKEKPRRLRAVALETGDTIDSKQITPTPNQWLRGVGVNDVFMVIIDDQPLQPVPTPSLNPSSSLNPTPSLSLNPATEFVELSDRSILSDGCGLPLAHVQPLNTSCPLPRVNWKNKTQPTTTTTTIIMREMTAVADLKVKVKPNRSAYVPFALHLFPFFF